MRDSKKKCSPGKESQGATSKESSVRHGADFLTQSERSQRMSRIRSRDTKIELVVRRLVHAMGFRYRLHSKQLPGHPDMVFASRRKVIFVHGCFWHLHQDCRQYRMPKTKLDFWLPKLDANRVRDEVNQQTLRDMGWDVLVIWECQLKNREDLSRRLRDFLEA